MKFLANFFLAFVAISVLAEDATPSASVLETNVLLIRATNLAPDFSARLSSLQSSNKMVGTILDLRFADGKSGAEPAGEFFSTLKTPLFILVNGQTRGAAADLATHLRAAGKCLVIGSTNSPGKISPDIAVNASAADEKKFQENPFARPTADKSSAVPATNDFLPFIDHTSEAELVRQRVKDGDQDDSKTPRPPAPQVIRDPALARAMDLFKALAVFNPAKK